MNSASVPLNSSDQSAVGQLVGAGLSSPQIVAVFEQRGADGEVFAPEAQAVLHRAGGVADLQAQIPQHVEHLSITLSAQAVIL